MRYLAAILFALCLSTNVVAQALAVVGQCQMPGSMQAAMQAMPTQHAGHHMAPLAAQDNAHACCDMAEQPPSSTHNPDDSCPMGLDCQPVHSVLVLEPLNLTVPSSQALVSSFLPYWPAAPAASLLRPPQA